MFKTIKIIDNQFLNNKIRWMMFLFRYYLRMFRSKFQKQFVIDEIHSVFLDSHGRSYNPSNLIFFNDKLTWHLINYFPILEADLSDKFIVRDYVKKIVGEKYLIDLYLATKAISDLKHFVFPNTFVIKVSHSSGLNIIVNDCDTFNLKLALIQLKRWQKINYYYFSWSRFIMHPKPTIIVEKLLRESSGLILNDYKFFCFNGSPELMYLSEKKYNNSGNLVDKKRRYFDMEYNEMVFTDEKMIKKRCVQKPEFFDQMKSIATKLSKPFNHVRVDLYFTDKIYFGELTFLHSNGKEKMPLKLEIFLGGFYSVNE